MNVTRSVLSKLLGGAVAWMVFSSWSFSGDSRVAPEPGAPGPKGNDEPVKYTTYPNFIRVMEAHDARYPAMTRVSDPGTREHPVYTGFFFYQCLQFDTTGRYMLGMKVYFEKRHIRPDDIAEIGCIDRKDQNKWTKIGETTAWNWQQGARLQWRPNSEEIVWNDRSDDGKTFVCRVYDFHTGKKRTLPRPIYDLSPDGITALTHDFEGDHQGTDYAPLGDKTKGPQSPSKTGIWKMRMDTGEAELIMPLNKMAATAFPRGIPKSGSFYIFREGWNPSGKRFITFVKDPENKLFEAYSMSANGTDVRYLYHNPSHHAWLDDDYIFDFGRHTPPGGGKAVNGYFLFKDDGSGTAKELLWPVEVDDGYGGDGHGSFVPGTRGEWIISDTYNIHGFQYLFLFHRPTRQFVPLAKLKCNRPNDVHRVDTHPRLSRDGRLVSIDATHEGLGRQMYVIEIGHILDNPPIARKAVSHHPRSRVAAGTPANFTAEKTSWHGFDRFDFLMDEAALTVKPIKAAPDEKNGIKAQVKGQLRCVVVVPKEAAPGKPWSWRGRYFDHEPQAEIELLNRGFHIGFIQSDSGKPWDAWYTFLTEKHGLSKKPAFIGMSGGGRNAFTWATTNPDKVSCIYADNPLITRESLMKLGELVQRDIPLLHICGSLDPLLGNHTLPVESIYQQLGGRISVMIKDGAGHHPHSLRDPNFIADFIVRSLEQAGEASPPFAGKKFTKSSFYGVENNYRDFPKEGMYITCRGPWFSDSYDRYEFKPDSTTGTVAVIAPKTAAPGTPWVLRADFVPRDAMVDLALLHKGFHIVTGPGPDSNGSVLRPWNAVYKYLIDQGFSTKPVMEGAGRAAGEVYAWAIANPDKVSCIYGENPILRSNMSKSQPLDNLAPLANAGVHLLHVCGNLDPSLKSQTRVAEQRYQKLGGRITIIIKEGEGHYPLAPKEPQPVVDFIIKRVAAVGSP